MNQLFAPWRMEYLTRECENGCIFCNAINHPNPDEKFIVGKSKNSFIIMNKYPYTNGHVMVVPFKHAGNLDELDDETYDDFMKNVKRAAQLLKSTFRCEGINIGANIGKAAGAGVADHIHFHLVPRWIGDTNFMPILSECRVISEHILDTFKRLKEGLLVTYT